MAEISRVTILAVDVGRGPDVIVDEPIAQEHPETVREIRRKAKERHDVGSMSPDLLPETLGAATVNLETGAVLSMTLES